MTACVGTNHTQSSCNDFKPVPVTATTQSRSSLYERARRTLATWSRSRSSAFGTPRICARCTPQSSYSVQPCAERRHAVPSPVVLPEFSCSVTCHRSAYLLGLTQAGNLSFCGLADCLCSFCRSISVRSVAVARQLCRSVNHSICDPDHLLSPFRSAHSPRPHTEGCDARTPIHVRSYAMPSQESGLLIDGPASVYYGTAVPLLCSHRSQ